MGTDIHPAVEVRRNGVWRYHRPKELCKWYAETYATQAEVDEVNQRRADYMTKNNHTERDMRGWPVHKLGDRRNTWDRCKYSLPEFFSERNYRVFAVIGDVRNGYGFAGVPTHDVIVPIQSNRGVPDDISDEARAMLSNEHSEGWVTLAELKAYDYDQDLTETGVVTEEQYERLFLAGTIPTEWSGGIRGKNIEVITPDQWLMLWENPAEIAVSISGRRRSKRWDRNMTYYVQASWTRKMRASGFATLPDEWIPYLEKLVPKGGTDDDVRVVFDFDS